MPKPRGKQFYEKIGNYISQKIQGIYPGSRTRLVGSRYTGDNRRESDLDYQFSIPNKTRQNRAEVYARIKDTLGPSFREPNGEKVNVRIGDSGNVINFQPENGGKISFALMD